MDNFVRAKRNRAAVTGCKHLNLTLRRLVLHKHNHEHKHRPMYKNGEFSFCYAYVYVSPVHSYNTYNCYAYVSRASLLELLVTFPDKGI